jgi:RNA polymerase sigma-70 factor (ECF subfamily)
MHPYEGDTGGLVDLSLDVRAARAGDEDAFGRLYTAVQPGLLRYLQLLVGKDAEDVASEAWRQIAGDLPSYRGAGAGFRTWVASVARRRAMAGLRRRSSQSARTALAGRPEQLPDREDTTPWEVDAAATAAAIALIATLPRYQAEAVLLRVVLGLDAEAIGQVLGKRAGTIRRATHRGLRQLARRLAQDDRARAPRPHMAGGTRVAGVGATR